MSARTRLNESLAPYCGRAAVTVVSGYIAFPMETGAAKSGVLIYPYKKIIIWLRWLKLRFDHRTFIFSRYPLLKMSWLELIRLSLTAFGVPLRVRDPGLPRFGDGIG